MNRLKYLRESAGLTQLAVAESLGITPQAVSNYERGINAVPCAYLLQLARLYSVSVESLLGACAVKTGRWLLTDAYPHRMYCSECFSTAVPKSRSKFEPGGVQKSVLFFFTHAFPMA